MENSKRARIVALSFLFLTIYILPITNRPTSTAQNKTAPSTLEGTEWKFKIDTVFVSGEGFYKFESQGKVTVITISTNFDLPPVIVSEDGTYTQKGTSVHMEFPSYHMDVIINGDLMESKDPDDELVARRISEGKQSEPNAITQSNTDKEKSDAKRQRVGRFAELFRRQHMASEESYQRGRTLQVNGHHREAIENFTQAISLNPTNIDAYLGRGGSKASLKDYRAAIEDFDKYIQGNPQGTARPAAYAERGSAKFQLQDYRGALADYNQCLQLLAAWKDNRKFSKLFLRISVINNRGMVKNKLGDKVGACEDFRKACSSGMSEACETSKKVCN